MEIWPADAVQQYNVTQGAEDILTPEGVMEVRLVEARNVPKMDLFGQGDPFGRCVFAPCSASACPTYSSRGCALFEEALAPASAALQLLFLSVADGCMVAIFLVRRTCFHA